MNASPGADSVGRYRGDFALLNPLPVLRDENGTYHCPLPIMRRSWTDSDAENLERAMCGEDLMLIWHLACSVPDHDGQETTITPETSAAWANYFQWELKCCSGHVLASSEDGSGLDDCIPFDSRHWFGPLPPITSLGAL